MSQAFVREDDAQWLHDVAPTLQALLVYLTRENNNIPAYEKENFIKDGRVVHRMNNGLDYSIGEDGKWFIVD